MKFENFFEDDIKKESNESEMDIVGFLLESCYRNNCGDEECIDCSCCVTDDATLEDLHHQIVNIVLDNPDIEISLDKKVLKSALKNTIESVQALKEDFKEAKEKALESAISYYIEKIQDNMKFDVGFDTLTTLLTLDEKSINK